MPSPRSTTTKRRAPLRPLLGIWYVSLLRLVRKSSVTLSIAAIWILVYLAMGIEYHRITGIDYPSCFLRYDVSVTTLFGDVSLGAIGRGEVWRPLTATFVHLHWLHIAINLFGLLQLGRAIENWYGSRMFALIYVVLGVGGNLIALAIKALENDPLHSAGGSTVIFGLVGLCAVGGWREGTKVGLTLYVQMMVLLVINGLLGAVIVGIDNDAHAGGVLVGALLGIADPWLVRQRKAKPRWPWIALVAAILLTVASAFLQTRAFEERRRLEVRWLQAVQDELDLINARELWNRVEARVRQIAYVEQVGDLQRRAELEIANSIRSRRILNEPFTVEQRRRQRDLLDAYRDRYRLSAQITLVTSLWQVEARLGDDRPLPEAIAHTWRFVGQPPSRPSLVSFARLSGAFKTELEAQIARAQVRRGELTERFRAFGIQPQAEDVRPRMLARPTRRKPEPLPDPSLVEIESE